MKVLSTLARLCAIMAGLLLIFITLMTCVSVVGRDLIGKTIVGDFELSGAAAGAAIALFMPWCQIRRGFPEWVVYAVMVPPLALTVLIALHQGLFGFAAQTTEDNPELAV